MTEDPQVKPWDTSEFRAQVAAHRRRHIVRAAQAQARAASFAAAMLVPPPRQGT